MRTHQVAGYAGLVREDLTRYEGRYAYVYSDGIGIPTIGIGINLREHRALVLRALGFDVEGRLEQISAAAWEAEQSSWNQLSELIDSRWPRNATEDGNVVHVTLEAILANRAADPRYAGVDLPGFSRATEFRLSEEQINQTFQAVLDGYSVPNALETSIPPEPGIEARLDDWLLDTGVAFVQPELLMRDSTERVALLSLTFNFCALAQ